MKGWAGVVLAAGRGSRMKSRLPKVLHLLAGRELVRYPVEAVRNLGLEHLLLVVSPENEPVLRQLLGDRVEFVQQPQPCGTGDALVQAILLLEGRAENVLVVGADTPLVQPTTLEPTTYRQVPS